MFAKDDFFHCEPTKCTDNPSDLDVDAAVLCDLGYYLHRMSKIKQIVAV